jgi:hypothetical protein
MTLNHDGTRPDGCANVDDCDKYQCLVCFVKAPPPEPTDWEQWVIDRPARCHGCPTPFVVFKGGRVIDPDSYAWVRRDETGKWVRYHDRCRPQPVTSPTPARPEAADEMSALEARAD